MNAKSSDFVTTSLPLDGAAVRMQAPAKTAALSDAPSVWSMPSRGIEWCDCGEHHALDRGTVWSFAKGILADPGSMTHEEIVGSAIELWNYLAVCGFFLMAVRASEIDVNGRPAPRYPVERGLEIVAHFSKTWQGCPEEACRLVRGSEG